MERTDFTSEGSASAQKAGMSADAAATSTPNQPASQPHGFADRARDVAGTAQEKLADVGSSVRDRAGNLKDSLANALDNGADRLRNRGASDGQLASPTDAGSVAVETSNRSSPVTTRVAGGMEATAGWLRETDLDSLKTGIERQVKEHPGRSLLVAVGLGYLIGKAVRK
jgi:ElaB/YqjD/DUF883 family membrane-anchored ribosome-binding protein